jgi:hypothetical protein
MRGILILQADKNKKPDKSFKTYRALKVMQGLAA